VSETSARTPAQAAVILSTEWRQAAREAGLTPEVRDPDQLEAHLQPLATKADGKAVVCFLDERGAEHAVCLPLPSSAAALQKLIKERVK